VRPSAAIIAIGVLTLLLSGCVADGGEYGYRTDIGIGTDYYELDGYDYGGWGPDYRVGPYRAGSPRPGRGAGNSIRHSYRPAPASHAMPSIPSGSRSGGARSGSSHPGGARSR
jgi:hypothetical protein